MDKKIILILMVAVFIVVLIIYFLLPKGKSAILKDFVGQNLRGEYSPRQLDVVHKLTYVGRTDGIETLYGSIWNVDETKFYANIEYNDLNENRISNLQIFVFPDVPALNEAVAISLITKYFKIKGDFVPTCRSIKDITYCEKFWTVEKKGVFVLTSPGVKFVGLCQYPKWSEIYEESTCVRIPFEKL